MNEEFETLKKDILVRVKEKLLKIDSFPYDFNSNVLHDVIHDEIDSFVTGISRVKALQLIDFCDNEEYIDAGAIDDSNLDRMIITTCYECLYLKLFDDDFFMELQEYELTEKQRDSFVKEIDKRMGRRYRHSKGRHSKTQIWIKTGFEIRPEMFKEPYFAEKQVIDLHDGSVKILTNNREVNRNAVVFEKHGEKKYRVYLMDKDKDIDIRDFFKYRSVSSPDYILNPNFYIKGRNEPVGNKYPYKTEFKDKKEFIFYVNQMVTELNKRE